MRRHNNELLELFYGDVRPFPDPILIMCLEFAGLATIGRKYLSWVLFFPQLVKRHTKRYEPLDETCDENVPPK